MIDSDVCHDFDDDDSNDNTFAWLIDDLISNKTW